MMADMKRPIPLLFLLCMLCCALPLMLLSASDEEVEATSAHEQKELVEPEQEGLELQAKQALIIIDAGHGGKDSGSIGTVETEEGVQKYYEKTFTLEIVLQLKALLEEAYPQYQVELTREDDTFVSLFDRSVITNKLAGDTKIPVVFVSVHANSHTTPKPFGFEVWSMPLAKRRWFRAFSPSVEENRRLNLESEAMANRMSTALNNQIGNFTNNRGVFQNSWYVLSHHFVPGILVELGFISHPTEATNLYTRWYQSRLVQALADGLHDYISQL